MVYTSVLNSHIAHFVKLYCLMFKGCSLVGSEMRTYVIDSRLIHCYPRDVVLGDSNVETQGEQQTQGLWSKGYPTQVCYKPVVQSTTARLIRLRLHEYHSTRLEPRAKSTFVRAGNFTDHINVVNQIKKTDEKFAQNLSKSDYDQISRKHKPNDCSRCRAA